MAAFLLLDDDVAERVCEVLEKYAPELHEQLSGSLDAMAAAVSPEWLSALMRFEADGTQGHSDRVLDALEAAQNAVVAELRDAGLTADRFTRLTTAEAERARHGMNLRVVCVNGART